MERNHEETRVSNSERLGKRVELFQAFWLKPGFIWNLELSRYPVALALITMRSLSKCEMETRDIHYSLTSTLAPYLVAQQQSTDLSVHSLLPRQKWYHQPPHYTRHHSSDHWIPFQHGPQPIPPSPRATYLAPPPALLNHEHTSCEKQSCVYTLPIAKPEQPAPQRPLQLYLWSMLGTTHLDVW
jgi:hypothetical protein